MELHLPVVIGLMVAALVLAIGAKRAHVPYNVALVVGGMLISLSHVLPEPPHLEPEVVFLVCLPALLFEGGFTAHLDSIRANLVPIALLATLGMLVAIGATGGFLHLALSLPWGPAVLLGCILAVTDTVSILFAFRRAPVPRRLAALVLGESLFNDGTALVAYAAISGIVVAGGPVAVPLLTAKVVLATVGGLAVGLALGTVGSFVIRRTEDPLAEIMATTALAFAAFVGAEELHVSGAIAGVTAGLTVGATARRTLSPSSQVAIQSFWEYMAFGVNTFLFLLVGLSSNPATLIASAPQTAIAVACVFAGRAAAIYLPFLILGWARPSQAVPPRWQHVFVLGNIKGALSIALALALPKATPFRPLLVDVAFGVTFISLVAQGLLLGRVLDRLGLTRRDPVASAVSEQQAKLVTARAARAELDTLHANGMVARMAYERLRSEYQVTIAAAEREIRQIQDRNLAQGARFLLAVRRRLIDAERAALSAAERTGLIEQEVAERHLLRLDERMLVLEGLLNDTRETDIRPARESAR